MDRPGTVGILAALHRPAGRGGGYGGNDRGAVSLTRLPVANSAVKASSIFTWYMVDNNRWECIDHQLRLAAQPFPREQVQQIPVLMAPMQAHR
jgi:hypothetical protein